MHLIVVLMGVSGCGKTTVGVILARELDWLFIEGDDYHPPANVLKMARGEPLTDEDRKPWLDRLHKVIGDLASRKQSAIVTCSALKQSYRDRLTEDITDICFVYLRGSRELVGKRLLQRTGHYMSSSLIDSQFDTLEEPDGTAITVDIGPAPEKVAAKILAQLHL